MALKEQPFLLLFSSLWVFWVVLQSAGRLSGAEWSQMVSLICLVVGGLVEGPQLSWLISAPLLPSSNVAWISLLCSRKSQFCSTTAFQASACVMFAIVPLAQQIVIPSLFVGTGRCDSSGTNFITVYDISRFCLFSTAIPCTFLGETLIFCFYSPTSAFFFVTHILSSKHIWLPLFSLIGKRHFYSCFLI